MKKNVLALQKLTSKTHSDGTVSNDQVNSQASLLACSLISFRC